jgi:hypothetical protein
MGSGHSFGQLLAGMAISGAGAATGELTGLAGYVYDKTGLDRYRTGLTW